MVDDRLRTSDPNIFAIGECASHRSHIYGLVAPGYDMADALAQHLIGVAAVFRGSTPATRLKLLGVDVATAGEPLERGFAIRFHADGIYRLLRVDRGRLVGALGVGDWPEFSRIQDATTRRIRTWPWQIARFERTGTLWSTARDLPVTDWPSHAVVCNCLSVTQGQIAAACAQRVVTVESLVERTGASTLCGSCRPLLEQLASAGAMRPARIPATLLVTSVAALALAAALLMTAPVPFAISIQDTFQPDVLWRNGTYRQVSGFALLVLSVLASLLSLRKRWRAVSSLGAFPGWRVVHVLIGTLTLATLAVHTGARLGNNLNFALMISFGTLNVLGGLAGGLTAIEQRLGGRAGRRFRAALVTAHVLAIWPLPTLVAFHVLSVYYF
jgi:nitrite reductase (NADH) large subunit